jgi:hypothetical protein
MSWDVDADGNKVFYEPELETEDYLKEFSIYFSGELVLNAFDESDALKRFDDLDLNTIFENIKNKEVN